DTTEPSPLSHEILNARPYAFLDDAPLEERRTQAVYTRRASDPGSASDLGALDEAAVARVREEVTPDPRDADELHDALVAAGFFTAEEMTAHDAAFTEQLLDAKRVSRLNVARGFSPAESAALKGCATLVWCPAERLPELRAIHPDATLDPPLDAPASRRARTWTRDEALVEILRGRLAIAGPTTAAAIAATIAVGRADVDTALLALEAEGVVLRGSFTASSARDAQAPNTERRSENGTV